MIGGTRWSHQRAFGDFVRTFIDCLVDNDLGGALAHLDQSERRWTKSELERALARATAGRLSPRPPRRSAAPGFTVVREGDVFELVHRLPVDGRWSSATVSFRFTRGRGEYFHVHLLGFETADAAS